MRRLLVLCLALSSLAVCADTYRWVADASAMTQVTPADLLSDGYLADRAKLIDPLHIGRLHQGMQGCA